MYLNLFLLKPKIDFKTLLNPHCSQANYVNGIHETFCSTWDLKLIILVVFIIIFEFNIDLMDGFT